MSLISLSGPSASTTFPFSIPTATPEATDAARDQDDQNHQGDEPPELAPPGNHTESIPLFR
jgi:hypothetical protein